MDAPLVNSSARRILGGFVYTCFSLLLAVGYFVEQRKPSSPWDWLFFVLIPSMVTFRVLRDWAYVLGLIKSKREARDAFAVSGSTAAVLLGAFTFLASFRFGVRAMQAYSCVLLLSGAIYLYPDVRGWLKEFRRGFRDGPPER